MVYLRAQFTANREWNSRRWQRRVHVELSPLEKQMLVIVTFGRFSIQVFHLRVRTLSLASLVCLHVRSQLRIVRPHKAIDDAVLLHKVKCRHCFHTR